MRRVAARDPRILGRASSRIRRRVELGANQSPVAQFALDTWSESADTFTGPLLRLVTYKLTLAVRTESAFDRFQQIDRLTSIAQNALEGSTLGGNCLSALSRVHHGHLDSKSTHPELRAILIGQFGYIVPSGTGHNTVRS